MSASLTAEPIPSSAPRPRSGAQTVTVVRAAVALLWAAALVIAVGDSAPTTHADVPTGAAALLALYPLIDVIASVVAAQRATADAPVLRVNAGISTLAVVALAIAAFTSNAGATLAAFGAWAAISGAIQLAVAIRRRRATGGQIPMLISGALSTLAGISFIASSQGTKANLAGIAGYMAFGAVLYLISSVVDRNRQPATR